MLNEKKRIRKELRNQLEIRVDYPVPCSGASNTGNTVRKFKNNIEKISEITQQDKNLLSKLSPVLKTLNSDDLI